MRVLEAAGYSVQITRKPVCCGLTWISTGQLDGARRQLRRSLDALDAAVRPASRSSGWSRRAPPCCAARSPSCCPTTPAPARCAPASRTLAELLTGTGDWQPPDLAGVRAVAQPHCHHHAVMGWHTDSALLARCGAAGRRGRRVLRAGRELRRRTRPLRRLAGRRRDRPAARRARRRSRTRWYWPTGSPAAPSSISSATSAASTWPSSWPAACTTAGDRPPGHRGGNNLPGNLTTGPLRSTRHVTANQAIQRRAQRHKRSLPNICAIPSTCVGCGSRAGQPGPRFRTPLRRVPRPGHRPPLPDADHFVRNLSISGGLLIAGAAADADRHRARRHDQGSAGGLR